MDDLGWLSKVWLFYVRSIKRRQLASSSRSRRKRQSADGTRKTLVRQYRYGVAGSIVKFIDAKYGRKRLKNAQGTSETELLVMKYQGTDLLEQWKASFFCEANNFHKRLLLAL